MSDALSGIDQLLGANAELLLDVPSASSESSAALRYHGDDEAIHVAVPAATMMFRQLRLNPHRVRFTVGDGEGGGVEGWGRAIVVGRLADHPEAASSLVESSGRAGAGGDPGEVMLVRIVPEELRLRDSASGGELSYVTDAGRERPSQRTIWIQAMRFFSLAFTVLAGLVGAGFALFHDGPVQWGLLPLILLGAFAFHVGANLTSEYFDYLRGVDRLETLGGTKLLVEGFLQPRAVLRAGLASFAVGVAIGLFIVSRVDAWILAFGAVGLVGGFFYGAGPLALKYRALGEAMVFVCFGPLMVIGSYYALTESFAWSVALASVPIGLLITAVLEANNTRDMVNDASARVVTVPIRVGLDAAVIGYAALIAIAFAMMTLLLAFRVVPWSTALVFLSLPLAVRNAREMLAVRDLGSPVLATMDVRTAQLVTQFVGLFVIALVIQRVVLGPLLGVSA